MNAALLLAFEAGTLLGHVQYDQQIDRMSLSDAAMSVFHSRKTGMPLHTVAPAEGRNAVRHILMSNERRKYLAEKAKEGLADAAKFLTYSQKEAP